MDGDVIFAARGAFAGAELGFGEGGRAVADQAGGPGEIDVFDGRGGLEGEDGSDEGGRVACAGVGGGRAVGDGEVVDGRVGGEEDGDVVE